MKHSTSVNNSDLGIYDSGIRNQDIANIEHKSSFSFEEIPSIKRRKKKHKKDFNEKYALNHIQSKDPDETKINNQSVLSNEQNIRSLKIGREREFNNETFPYNSGKINNLQISNRKKQSKVHTTYLGNSNVDIDIIEKNSNIYERISPIKHIKRTVVENYFTISNTQSEDLNIAKEKKNTQSTIPCNSGKVDNLKRQKHPMVHTSYLGITNCDIQNHDVAIIEENSNICEEIVPIKYIKKKHKKHKNKDVVENYITISNVQSSNVAKEREFNNKESTIPCNSEKNDSFKRQKHRTVHTSYLGITKCAIQNHDIAVIEENSNICKEIVPVKYAKKKHKNKEVVENFSTVSNIQSSNLINETTSHTSYLGISNSDIQNHDIAVNEENFITKCNKIAPIKHKNRKHENKILVENYSAVCNMKSEDPNVNDTNSKLVLSTGQNIQNLNVETEREFNCKADLKTVNNLESGKRKKHPTVHTSYLDISNSDIQNHGIFMTEENSKICNTIAAIKSKNKKRKHKDKGLDEIENNEIGHSMESEDHSVKNKKHKDKVENYSSVSNMQSEYLSVKNTNGEVVVTNELNILNLNIGKGNNFIYEANSVPCYLEQIDNHKSGGKKKHSTVHSSNLSTTKSDIKCHNNSIIEENSNICDEISPSKCKRKKHKKNKNKVFDDNYSTIFNIESEDPSVNDTKNEPFLCNEQKIINLNAGKERKFNHKAYTILSNSRKIYNLKSDKRKKHSAIHTSCSGILNCDTCEEIASVKCRNKKHKNKHLVGKYSTVSNMQSEKPSVKNTSDEIVFSNEFSIKNLNVETEDESNREAGHNPCNSENIDNFKIIKKKKHSTVHTTDLGNSNSDFQTYIAINKNNSNICEAISSVKPIYKNEKHKHKIKHKNKNSVKNCLTVSNMQPEDHSVKGMNDELILSNEQSIQNLNVGKIREFNPEAYTILCSSEKVGNIKNNKKRKKHSTVHSSDLDISNSDIQNHDITLTEKESYTHSEEMSPIKHKSKKHKRDINEVLVKKHSLSNVTTDDSNIANINVQFNLSNNIQNVNIMENDTNCNDKYYTISDHSEVIYSIENSFSSGTFDEDVDPVDFEIPPLHKYETVNRLSSHQKEELISQGVVIKLGRFTLAEDEVILNNFKEFAYRYKVSDPFQLLGIGRYAADSTVLKCLKAKHFYVRLGKGLNDRSLHSIYKRARIILHPSRITGKAENDTISSIKYLKTCIGKKWNKIGDTLGRSGENCLQTSRWHEDAFSKGRWTAEEEKILIKAIQKVSGFSDVSCEKIKKISWEQVAAHVPTRNYSQCRWYWANHLAWKTNSLKRNWNKNCYVKFIDVLSKDFNVEHASLIQWEKVYKHFEDVSPSCLNLQKRWLYLKSRIPGHKTMPYKDIISKLCMMYKVI